jgi:two-component system OmpR family response regulator
LRILLLEDDLDAAQRVAAALRGLPEAQLTHVSRGDEALKRAAAEAFDVLILDRMVEGLDGLAALERLRALEVRTPALVLSNLGATRNRIEGLDAGADDYLAKPFEADELVARLRALVRRAGAQASPDALVIGGLDVRLKARTVHWNGRHVDLSPKEFEILKFLAENHDVVVSREMIWNAAWPEYRIPPQVNVIDVNLSRLRGKLEAAAGRALVETVRKQGFVLRSVQGV